MESPTKMKTRQSLKKNLHQALVKTVKKMTTTTTVMCSSWNKTDLFDKKNRPKTDPKWPKGLLNRPRSVKTDPIGSSADMPISLAECDQIKCYK